MPTDAAAEHHRRFYPIQKEWSGLYPFKQFTFAGDSMFVGVYIVGRLDQNVDWRGGCLGRKVGPNRTTRGKLEIEGIFSTRDGLLGFHGDADTVGILST